MDPLTALGLAANIIQFLDFAGKVYAASKEIYDSGTLSSNEQLRLLVEDAEKVSKNLSSALSSGTEQQSLSPDDEAIKSLAQECAAVSQDLCNQLEGLRFDHNGKSKWRTAKTVLRAIWSEEKINKIFKRLEGVRSELSFRLTVIMKQRIDLLHVLQDRRFSDLDDTVASVVKHLAQSSENITAVIANRTTQLELRQESSEQLALRLHSETMSAIQQLGLLQMSANITTVESVPDVSSHAPSLTVEEATEMLLESLRFRQMHDREEDVSDHHEKTFEWVLDAQEAPHKASFHPLLHWFQKEDGCYWISGKAGSGKSTLIKMLRSSTVVANAIRSWAGDCEYTVAAHYFWRGGTSLQRSQEGLLRILLYYVLSERRDVVPVCFPDIEKIMEENAARKADDHAPGDNSDISQIVPDLDFVKKMFLRLSKSKLSDFKCFLFIDGVDEYEGDYGEICTFFRQLAENSMFKIILSSRPIPACVEAFSKCPMLQLQDLTYHDIKKFVEDRICDHDTMQLLLVDDPGGASKLTETLITKAEGVFLWVSLAVKSLLDGFRDFDRIRDLQRRIDRLPTELTSLYMHMFESMKPAHQVRGAKFLKLIYQSILVQENTYLSPLQLSFAYERHETGDDSRSLTSFGRGLGAQRAQAKSKIIEGMLRSHCCGLVEVTHVTDEEVPFSVLRQRVQFLHRSVFDFLQTSSVSQRIDDLTADLDSNYCLLQSCVDLLEAIPTEWDHEPTSVMRDCLAYCQLIEQFESREQSGILYELNRVMRRREEEGGRTVTVHRQYLPDLRNPSLADRPRYYRSVKARPDTLLMPILQAAMELGMTQTLQHLLDQDASGPLSELDIFSAVLLILRKIGAHQHYRFPLSQARVAKYLDKDSNQAYNPVIVSLVDNLLRHAFEEKLVGPFVCSFNVLELVIRAISRQESSVMDHPDPERIEVALLIFESFYSIWEAYTNKHLEPLNNHITFSDDSIGVISYDKHWGIENLYPHINVIRMGLRTSPLSKRLEELNHKLRGASKDKDSALIRVRELLARVKKHDEVFSMPSLCFSRNEQGEYLRVRDIPWSEWLASHYDPDSLEPRHYGGSSYAHLPGASRTTGSEIYELDDNYVSSIRHGASAFTDGSPSQSLES